MFSLLTPLLLLSGSVIVSFDLAEDLTKSAGKSASDLYVELYEMISVGGVRLCKGWGAI